MLRDAEPEPDVDVEAAERDWRIATSAVVGIKRGG